MKGALDREREVDRRSLLIDGAAPELRVYYRSIARVPYLVRFRVAREGVFYVGEWEITDGDWEAGT